MSNETKMSDFFERNSTEHPQSWSDEKCHYVHNAIVSFDSNQALIKQQAELIKKQAEQIASYENEIENHIVEVNKYSSRWKRSRDVVSKQAADIKLLRGAGQLLVARGTRSNNAFDLNTLVKVLEATKQEVSE